MVQDFDLVELLRFCCGNLFVSFFGGGGGKDPPQSRNLMFLHKEIIP